MFFFAKKYHSIYGITFACDRCTTYTAIVADSSIQKKVEKMKKHSESGFTLMELMIVVSIIAILSAVAVPNYVDYTRRAKDQATEGVAGNIANFIKQCLQFNGSVDRKLVTYGPDSWTRLVCTVGTTENSFIDIVKITEFDFKLFSDKKSFAIKGIGGSKAFYYQDGLTPEPLSVESKSSEETAEKAYYGVITGSGGSLVIEQMAE